MLIVTLICMKDSTNVQSTSLSVLTCLNGDTSIAFNGTIRFYLEKSYIYILELRS